MLETMLSAGVSTGAMRLMSAHNLLLAQADPLAAGSAPASAAPAASGSPVAGPGGGAGWISWAMMLGIFAVFYFLVLRPQQKRASTHKSFLDALQVGSSVVTTGGIYGTIVAMEDQIVRLEVAPRTEIRVHKSHIAGAQADAANALASANQR